MNELRKIIVDDFGYSEEINQLVISAADKKILNHISVMVNMPGQKSAIEFIKNQLESGKNHQLHFGLHLNLTEGKPLSDYQKVSSLINNQGEFLGWQKLAVKMLLGQVKKEELELEIFAQLQKLAEIVPQIQFVNSHHHIHTWPTISDIIICYCHKNQLEIFRCPSKIWYQWNVFQYWVKALLIQLAGKWVSHKFHPSSRYFVDLDWAGLNPQKRKKLFSKLPNDCEISCHPHYNQFHLTDPANLELSTLAWLMKSHKKNN